MLKNPTSRLGFVAACVMAISSLATSQQVQAGPFGSSDRIPRERITPLPSSPSGPKLPKPGGSFLDKLPQELNKNTQRPSQLLKGDEIGGFNTVEPRPGSGPPPAEKQARPNMPESRPGKHGHRWEGMAAGVLGGMALGAMMSQAQARPSYSDGSACYYERRRVWDEFGNRFYRKVRVCEE
jgi:hypothetical protein